MTLFRCSRCPLEVSDPSQLLELGAEWLCSGCFLADHHIAPPASAAAVHARETATREAMMKRGGADAYRVRAGKT
jgi:hypothetical protein